MRARHLVLLGLIAVANSGGFCGGPAPPSPDSCATPAERGTLDSLELGGGDESQFAPISDGQKVHLIVGPQGGTMLPIRLHVSGAGAVGCLPQRSVIDKDGTGNFPVASSSAPLRTYAEPDGSATTRALYLIFDGGAQNGDTLLITVDAGGRHAQVSVIATY